MEEIELAASVATDAASRGFRSPTYPGRPETPGLFSGVRSMSQSCLLLEELLRIATVFQSQNLREDEEYRALLCSKLERITKIRELLLSDPPPTLPFRECLHLMDRLHRVANQTCASCPFRASEGFADLVKQLRYEHYALNEFWKYHAVEQEDSYETIAFGKTAPVKIKIDSSLNSASVPSWFENLPKGQLPEDAKGLFRCLWGKDKVSFVSLIRSLGFDSPEYDDSEVILRQAITRLRAFFKSNKRPEIYRWKITEEKAGSILLVWLEQIEFVTLDQIAAVVGVAKRTVERFLNQPREAGRSAWHRQPRNDRIDPDLRMPRADISGGSGKAALWAWPNVRESLELRFKKPLPEKFVSGSSIDVGDTDRHTPTSNQI